ncbi:hypothetical protein T11_545 [Trichinella zimbabwensis]|uniref:PiggyBac transposable element-derived protein domain-containing protein n=1 Tax=Trichinella zimbabwensis TaxID=268475 RepID=A0A0V1HLA6_9BILA|nr:hypothetical protein T11_545 [Trichinella zimbabwensis]
MLTSYVPKKGCAVVILSSQHCGNYVSKGETNFKPQVICDYNKTKGAVDTVDKMLKNYSMPEKHKTLAAGSSHGHVGHGRT